MQDRFWENKYAEYWINNGILFIESKPSLEALNLDVIKVIIKDREKFCQKRSYPVYFDPCKMGNFEIKARNYMASKNAQLNVRASAIMIYNTMQKLLGNLYLNLNQPPIPLRLFLEKENAVKWLEQYKALHMGSVKQQ